MNNLGLLGIRRRKPGHAVAETHADSDEHVALLRLHVRSIASVHAEHAHVQGMV